MPTGSSFASSSSSPRSPRDELALFPKRPVPSFEDLGPRGALGPLLSAAKEHLISSHAGNLSRRDGDSIVITASGAALADLRDEDMAEVRLQIKILSLTAHYLVADCYLEDAGHRTELYNLQCKSRAVGFVACSPFCVSVPAFCLVP